MLLLMLMLLLITMVIIFANFVTVMILVRVCRLHWLC